MFEATLKNRISAHLAPVTITFPIPEDQYEQAILALEKSQIGDARVQDGLIDKAVFRIKPAGNIGVDRVKIVEIRPELGQGGNAGQQGADEQQTDQGTETMLPRAAAPPDSVHVHPSLLF